MIQRTFFALGGLIIVGLPLGAAEFRTGFLPGPLPAGPSTSQASVRSTAAAAAATLPASASLLAWMPPSLAQGTQGSCVAWALSYGIMGYYARKYNWDDRDFSPGYIYNQVNGGIDKGSIFGDQVRVMAIRGVCPLALMPYDATNFLAWPTQVQAVAAHRYRIASWSWVPTRKQSDPNCLSIIKQTLVDGDPVALGIHQDTTWEALSGSNPTWNPPASSESLVKKNGHAVVICGFDDSVGAFLVHNSYGPGWGQSGRAWIPYALFNTGFVQDYGARLIPFTAPQGSVVELRMTAGSVSRGSLSVQTQVGSGPLSDHYFTLYRETVPDADNMTFRDDNPGLVASMDLSASNAQWPPTPSRPWKLTVKDRIIDAKPAVLSGIQLVRNGTTFVNPEPYVSAMADGATQVITFTWTQRYTGSQANGLVLPYGVIGRASAIEISNARQEYSASQSTSVEAYESIRLKPETTIRSEFRANIVPVPANG